MGSQPVAVLGIPVNPVKPHQLWSHQTTCSNPGGLEAASAAPKHEPRLWVIRPANGAAHGEQVDPLRPAEVKQ